MSALDHKPSEVIAHELAMHKKLWARVLLLGAHDGAREYRQLEKRLEKDPAASPNSYPALRWVFSELKGPGTFIWLCSLLDRDPEMTRQRWAANASRIGELGEQKGFRRSSLVRLSIEETT